MNCEKNTIFPQHPVLYVCLINLARTAELYAWSINKYVAGCFLCVKRCSIFFTVSAANFSFIITTSKDFESFIR